MTTKEGEFQPEARPRVHALAQALIEHKDLSGKTATEIILDAQRKAVLAKNGTK